MSAFTPYQAYPSPAPAAPAGPPPVLVGVAGPAPQGRAAVAFRLVLAVPHLFVLYFVGIAAGVIAFIGWWGALLRGELPEFAATFLAGCLRWQARVHAYLMLLTDVYPPFSLDDDPRYPVRVAVPAGQPLNPAAVLFRLVLAFPAAVVAGLAVLGGTVVSFIAWLVVLVSGQLPAAPHQAYSAVLRYYTRYAGYWWMLTAAYPEGLTGDQPGAGQYFPLTLSSSARGLVRTFVALGVLAYAGYLILPVALLVAVSSGSDARTAGNAVDRMNASYGTLTSELAGWQGAMKACQGDLTCVTKQDARAAGYLTAFDTRLAATPVPGGAVTAQRRLSGDATAAARDFTQLSRARTVSAYHATFARTGLQRTLDTFSQDYGAFVQRLLAF